MINELTDEGSGVRGRAATSIICWSGSGVLHDDMSEASFVQFVPSLNRGTRPPKGAGGRRAVPHSTGCASYRRATSDTNF